MTVIAKTRRFEEVAHRMMTHLFRIMMAGIIFAAAPMTSGLGRIQSGSLETSNVDLASQMAALITAQRAFEANAKIITTSDEVMQDLVNLKR